MTLLHTNREVRPACGRQQLLEDPVLVLIVGAIKKFTFCFFKSVHYDLKSNRFFLVLFYQKMVVKADCMIVLCLNTKKTMGAIKLLLVIKCRCYRKKDVR